MNAADTGADAGHAVDAAEGHDPPDQARLRQLADEQAALRRVATLVASGARPAEVFSAIADELPPDRRRGDVRLQCGPFKPSPAGGARG